MTQWGGDPNSDADKPSEPDPWAAPPATPPTAPPPAQPDPWAAPAAPPAAPTPPPTFSTPPPPPPPPPPSPGYGAAPPPPPPPPPGYGPPPGAPQYGAPPQGGPQYGAPPPYSSAPPPPPPGYGQPPMYGQQPGYGFPPPAYGGMPAVGQTPFGPVASWGARFGAQFIDWILVAIPVAILGAMMGAFSSSVSCNGQGICTTNSGSNGIVDLLGLIAGVAYYGYFDGIRGQTVGKQLLNIKAVDINTGQAVGFGRAVLRKFILGLSLLLCLVGAFSPFFDGTKRMQGWHDKVANDFVIKTR